MQAIADWLEKLGLPEYAQRFAENDIDVSVLPHLTDQDLKELGVSLGHRRKMLAAIAELAGGAVPTSPQPALAEPKPQDSAERRQVTVMFSDLVGSMALSARMDPEDLREVIAAYHKCVAEIVRGFGGFVAQYLGDGVLVYFGYPEAHEDDAERSVRAGLELVAAVGGLKTRASLQTRVGIATGLVVVGDLMDAGNTQERGIIGETPNLAARLQGIAEPNMVIIAEATRRLLGNLFQLQDLGARDLKGIAGPVRSWAALRASSVESRFEALHATDLTALVGREEEAELLRRRWARAKTGEGQVVLLSGEAGIGKSRLTAALLERLVAEPHTRLRYFCSPQHTDSALYPIIGQMERAAGLAHDDTPQARLDKLDVLLTQTATSKQNVALIAEMLSLPNDGRYPALELTPQQRRQRTLEALIAQMQSLTRQNPVLMVFEDAHWTDPTSLELFGRVMDPIPTLRVLLIVTFRREFDPPWIGRPHVTALTINRLTELEIGAMIDQVLGNKRLPANIRQEIIERTDGIPLFVEEMTKAVLEAESEGAAEHVAAAVPSPALAVPASLHASLMARLDRLGPAKELAQIGAAIGREFAHALLAAVVHKPEGELGSALDRLIAAGLLFRQGVPPHANYLFKHALVRDAAYSSLLRNRRAEIHGTIASAIEATFPDIVQAQPEIIAHHLTEAGLIERAVPMWVQAGRNAARKSANTEAIQHFNKALDLVDSMPDGEARKRQELAIQINLGPVYMTAKGFGAPEVGAAYARARDLAKDLQDLSQLFTSIWGLWLFNLIQPRKGPARSLSEELLSLGVRNADSGQILQACHASWTTNFFLGDFKYTSDQARRGRELYDASKHRTHKFLYGGHDPGVCSRMFGAASAFVLGFPDHALAATREGLDLARTLDHPLSLLLAELWLVIIHLLRGETREVGPILDRAICVASEAGIPRQMWANFLNGWALSGDSASDGVSRSLSDFDAVGAAGQEVFPPYYTGVLADMCRAAGRIDDGLGFVDKALALAPSQDSQWCLAELHRIKGELMLARGELTAAVEPCFETAIAIAREQSAKSWELRATVSLGRLRHSQGRSAEAKNLLAPVYNWFTEGFDIPDLKGANALLETLSSGNGQ
jgi:class 3 adenylate cyclase/predicted ATPase